MFFSDQNETTMRVIGLAMHQVEYRRSIRVETTINDLFSVSSMNKKNEIDKPPAIVAIQQYLSSIYQLSTRVWWISLRWFNWKMSKLKPTVSDVDHVVSSIWLIRSTQVNSPRSVALSFVWVIRNVWSFDWPSNVRPVGWRSVWPVRMVNKPNPNVVRRPVVSVDLSCNNVHIR